MLRVPHQNGATGCAKAGCLAAKPANENSRMRKVPIINVMNITKLK
jgi:hypothetical protein